MGKVHALPTRKEFKIAAPQEIDGVVLKSLPSNLLEMLRTAAGICPELRQHADYRAVGGQLFVLLQKAANADITHDELRPIYERFHRVITSSSEVCAIVSTPLAERSKENLTNLGFCPADYEELVAYNRETITQWFVDRSATADACEILDARMVIMQIREEYRDLVILAIAEILALDPRNKLLCDGINEEVRARDPLANVEETPKTVSPLSFEDKFLPSCSVENLEDISDEPIREVIRRARQNIQNPKMVGNLADLKTRESFAKRLVDPDQDLYPYPPKRQRKRKPIDPKPASPSRPAANEDLVFELHGELSGRALEAIERGAIPEVARVGATRRRRGFHLVS